MNSFTGNPSFPPKVPPVRTLLLPILFTILGSSALVAEPGLGQPTFTPEQIEFYKKSVQPILADNCYKCHGGGEANAEGKFKVKGGLQLISRLGILKGGDHGPAFDASAPANSRLLKAVGYDDPKLQMPPTGRLPEEERNVLKQWVEMGLPWTPGEENKIVAAAEDSGHATTGPDNTWTYEPLKKITPPAPPKSSSNPIDAFLIAKLQEKKLTYSPPASREALIRRAYYDLTGLPPTPEQVQEFVKSTDPKAYQNLINSLLASPHYGEKYGRHWLDLVRYAESNGFERDGFKDQIWRYRQWVVDSLNADKPYDQFVREQLAGDELDRVTPDTLLGTGYWNLVQFDDEPADRLLHSFDVMDDNVRITGETFLGMTIGCARCHNHKVDPISQKDYFSFMSFVRGLSPYTKLRGPKDLLASIPKPTKVLEPHQASATGDDISTLQRMENDLHNFHKNARLHATQKLKTPPPSDLGKVLVADSRKAPTTWDYTTTAPNDEHWPDPGFNPSPDKGWKQGSGGFGSAPLNGSPARTMWTTPEIWLRTYFQLTSIPKALNLTIAHDENADIYLNGKRVRELKGQLSQYITIALGADAIPALQTGKNVLAIRVTQTAGAQFVDAGLEIGDPDSTALVAKHGAALFEPAHLEKLKNLEQQIASLYDAAKAVEMKSVKAQIAGEEKGVPDMFVHLRGNPHVPGEKVEPAFPSVFKAGAPQITPTDRSSGRRRALADWITDPKNPRTARVIANRLWQWHFGRGLNPYSNDFGKLGGNVSHPELLDFLAQELIANQWSMKSMHRLIMTSQAYQQAAAYKDPKHPGHATDPTNTLWWRFDMRRLTSEEVRDSILKVSGNLNPAFGGPSMMVTLPREVIATSSNGAGWRPSPPQEQTRRSIYMTSKRSLSVPIMSDFDQADTDNPCPVRFSTTVPTQALNFLNSEFVNQQAVEFMKRLQTEHPNNLAAMIKRGLELTTQRPPKESEIKQLLELHQNFLTKHQTTPEVALARVSLALLNLNELIYLD